jgi:hypothetical protein
MPWTVAAFTLEGSLPEDMAHSHTHDRSTRDNRPYWQRAHHDWKFWVGMCLMLGALAIFVMTDNLALVPKVHR